MNFIRRLHVFHLATIPAIGLVLASACSIKQNLDEMHDATVGMAQTTDHMEDSTEKVAKTTESMSNTTQEMAIDTERLRVLTEEMARTTAQLRDFTEATYEDLRQGSSLTIRSERLASMEKSTSIEAKISEAGKFMMALEFQLWKKRVDDAPKREALYEDAVVELLRSVKNYLPQNIEDLNDVSPASKDNQMQNLYALATALHRINPNQQEQAEKLGFQPISMLDILKSGLELGYAIKRDERDYMTIPAYIREILRDEQTVVYLLRLRHNFLAAMPLACISDIDHSGFLGISGLYTKASMYFAKWEANVKDLNSTQLDYLALKLSHSLLMRDFLLSVGIDPMTDKNILKIYRNMRINAGSATAAGKNGDPLLKEFKDAVARLLN